MLVGTNEAGKTTILQALELAVAGKFQGRPAAQALSQFWFNQGTVRAYLSALRDGNHSIEIPEIIIEAYFAPRSLSDTHMGKNNSRLQDVNGCRLRVSFNQEFAAEYAATLSDENQIESLPVEYFKVDWHDFGGHAITSRGLQVRVSVIDKARGSDSRGVDMFVQDYLREHLSPHDRARIARARRVVNDSLESTDALAGPNSAIVNAENSITEKLFSLALQDIGSKSWETGIIAMLDGIPLAFAGQGEQTTIKTLLALDKGAEGSHLVLVEEPENHLSHTELNRLLEKVTRRCAGKQLIVSTHSSFVLNKLGIDHLTLIQGSKSIKLSGLSGDTPDFFHKLSSSDTLRIAVASNVVLVEGPSDELIYTKAFQDANGKTPLEAGIDVIVVDSLAFRRYLEIATALGRKTAVITDNDGDVIAARQRFEGFEVRDLIQGFIGSPDRGHTLEPQLIEAIGETQLREMLPIGKSMKSTLDFMTTHKTESALAILLHRNKLPMPDYIRDAVAFFE